MRTHRVLVLGLAALAVGSPARAAERPAKGRIAGADLFKNGLAVVRYEVTSASPATTFSTTCRSPSTAPTTSRRTPRSRPGCGCARST
ncbi:MAG: hypothetical protein K2P78_07225 [Gemmataceae bacterium]|nr:hypothetical protein [Gemmataceae bacterium]